MEVVGLRFCQFHLDMIRIEVDHVGLGSLIIESDEEKKSRILRALEEQRITKDSFEPVIICTSIVANALMEIFGPTLLIAGMIHCPICVLKENDPHSKESKFPCNCKKERIDYESSLTLAAQDTLDLWKELYD